MYSSNGFGKSPPHKIVNLLFTITNQNNKLTILLGVDFPKPFNYTLCEVKVSGPDPPRSAVVPHVPHVHRSSFLLLECLPSRIPSHHLRATTSLWLPPVAVVFPADPCARCVPLPAAAMRGFFSVDGGADLPGRWRWLASLTEQFTPYDREAGCASARDVRTGGCEIGTLPVLNSSPRTFTNRAAAEGNIEMGSAQSGHEPG